MRVFAATPPSRSRESRDDDGSHAQALGKKSDDADALINLITCSAHMGKDDKEINRYQQLLYGAHPNHPYVVNMKAKEAEFDRLAAEYLEKEGLEEDAEGNLVKVGN